MNFFQSRKSLIISFISFLLALFLIFVMAGNNRIKDYLNDLTSDSIVSRPYQEMQSILPDYFNFLLNSAFWIEAGGMPDDLSSVNLELLNRGALKSLPGLAALNYYSGSGTLSFSPVDGEVQVRKIENAIFPDQRIPLGKSFINDGSSDSESIYLSPIHGLESTGESGFSISIEITQAPRTSLSLDISLSGFISHYREVFGENAVLFSTFNSGDFLAIPLDSSITKEVQSEKQLFYDGLVRTALDWDGEIDEDKPKLVEYNGSIWFVLSNELNDYSSTIGFILPESKLFFSRFDQFYLLAAVPLILLFFILITIFFITTSREKNRMSEEELLLQLIEKGESKSLEFKSSLRWDYREGHLNKKLEEVILKSIAAFANSAGGILLIGVDDDGNPLGLEPDYKTLKHPDRDGFELHLRNLASAMYDTFTSRKTDVEFISVKGKDICKITVDSASTPLFTSMTNKNGVKQEQFYIRDGNLSRRIESLKDITDYCRKRFV